MNTIKQYKADSHGNTFTSVVMSAFNLKNQRHCKTAYIAPGCFLVEILINGDWVEFGAVDHGEYWNFVKFEVATA